MTSATELVTRFKTLFGEHGGERLPGNTGPDRAVVATCSELMALKEPVLHDYFQAWDKLGIEKNPLACELGLLRIVAWESAWSLAQLHYDQMLKQEANSKSRHHKKHPLCGLAILAREIRSYSLTRHFAMLSSAGDVYCEHNDTNLKDGGFGPTMLEQFQSNQFQCQWRERVRGQLAQWECDKPYFLEALLAAGWFKDARSQHVLDLAEVTKQRTKPFTEVLLDAVENPPKNANTTKTGTRFEAAAGLLLSSTPGFEVDSARKTADEQIDLVVRYQPESLCRLGLESGYGLVECKSSAGPVTVSELRDFGAKCLFHRVRFGILVARGGLTAGQTKFQEPQNAELVRRRFQVDGLTLLVLDLSQLRGKARELRGLHDDLHENHQQLVFGAVP